MAISESVKLYGTDEPVEPMQVLKAGPLSVCFDGGALRYISIDGIEAIRNIDFVVRDKNWGTYATELSNLKIEQQGDGFRISYDASCGDAAQQLNYKVNIAGRSDGSLNIKATGYALTDFVTNRTGFVILHPINGVAGEPVTIEKVSGELIHSSFPRQVDPIQPHKDLRALTHQLQSGRSIRCEMIGDTFEMEDHRQWNDASFKTYVRPLAEPWPYTLAAGPIPDQAVLISLIDDRSSGSIHTASSTKPTIIKVESETHKAFMPKIGMGLEPQHLHETLSLPDQYLKQLNLDHLISWHCIGEHSHVELERANTIATRANANLNLQVVIPDENYRSEISELASQCQQSGVSPSTVTVSPAMYLKSLMPTNPWPDVTSLCDIYDTVRQQFPNSEIGGGMLSFFPELNRYRPPIEHIDFVTHASNTITHACDDITVMENLEALPHIIESCRSFIQGKPYHLGPSSIGMRFNPYGSTTMDNTDNIRTAMARIDPRQRGLFNAAWTLGYLAHAARGEIDSVSLHAPIGEFGVINSQQSWQQPGFDNTDRIVFPAYHVLAGITGASGCAQFKTASSNSREVEVLAYESAGKQVIWIANLSNKNQTIEVQGALHNLMDVATLSVQTWDKCSRDLLGFEKTSQRLTPADLLLGPYAVIRLSVS